MTFIKHAVLPLAVLVALTLTACRDSGDTGGLARSTLTFEAACGEPFGYIGGVRELHDGRVVVADPLGMALVVANLDAGTVDTVGRNGSGPEEYRQPDRVLALPGDSTLLVDLGNSRLTVLDPDLRFASHTAIAQNLAEGGAALVVPRFTDDEGRFYFRSEAAGGGRSSDSVAVARFDRATGVVDTIVKIALPVRRLPPPPPGVGPTLPPDLLKPRDDWAVARDGSVATVTAQRYAVNWLSAGGEPLRGPTIAYDPVRLGPEDRAALLGQLMSAHLGMSAGAGRGRVGMRRGISAASASLEDALEWPDVLPAFRPGRTLVSSEGSLWVERYTLPGRAPFVDVFDDTGVRYAGIELPLGTRVAGFGSGVVYLARVDSVGLEWLERYALD